MLQLSGAGRLLRSKRYNKLYFFQKSGFGELAPERVRMHLFLWLATPTDTHKRHHARCQSVGRSSGAVRQKQPLEWLFCFACVHRSETYFSRLFRDRFQVKTVCVIVRVSCSFSVGNCIGWWWCFDSFRHHAAHAAFVASVSGRAKLLLGKYIAVLHGTVRNSPTF